MYVYIYLYIYNSCAVLFYVMTVHASVSNNVSIAVQYQSAKLECGMYYSWTLSEMCCHRTWLGSVRWSSKRVIVTTPFQYAFYACDPLWVRVVVDRQLTGATTLYLLNRM